MPQLLLLFSKAPDVIAIGITKAYISLPFLLLLALSQVMAGLFRGAGKSK